MGKTDDKDEDKGTDSGRTTVVPTVRSDDPPPSAASPAPTNRTTGSARDVSPGPGKAVDDVVTQVGDVAAASLRVTKRLLPGRAPAYLGAGALLVAGIVDLPALVAGGLAYEALRRWNTAPS